MKGREAGFRCLISGHDIERWMLKVAAVVATSGNFSKAGSRSHARLHPSIQLAEYLQDPSAWPRQSGLYIRGHLGMDVGFRQSIEIAPLIHEETDSIVGMNLSLRGLEFILPASTPPGFEALLQGTMYRPPKLSNNLPGGRSQLRLSWRDRDSRTKERVLVEPSGIEPLTSSLRTTRSTN